MAQNARRNRLRQCFALSWTFIATLGLLVVAWTAQAALGPIPGLPNAPYYPPTPASSPIVKEAIEAYFAGDLTRAIARYREAVAANPNDIGLRADLAVALKDDFRFDEAATEYRWLAQREPKNPAWPADLGWVLYAQGQLQAAATAFRQALALDASHVPARYGLGRTVLLLGDLDAALQELNQVTKADPHYAPAFKDLGEVHERQGNDRLAVDAYLRALALDWSMTELNLKLADLYLKLGELRWALDYYDRALRARGWDPAVKAAVDRFSQQNTDVVQQMREAKEVKQTQLTPTPVKPVPNPDGKIPLIRVGLAEKAQIIRFRSSGPFTAQADGQASLRGNGAELWTASWDKESVVLTGPGGRTLRSRTTIKVVPDSYEHTFLLYDMEFDRGYFWSTTEDRVYRGHIEFLPRDGITVVNVLNVEEYLYSNVPSEMPASWPAEALKAQAIAARTYTLFHRGQYASRGFDVLASTRSAAYHGVTWERPATTAAVDATKGQVLRYNGRLIDAVYSSTHGGLGEAAVAVWGNHVPYLQASWGGLAPPAQTSQPPGPFGLEQWIKGLPETYDSLSSYASRSSYRWIRIIPVEEVLGRLPAKVDIGNLTAVKVLDRTPTGRANRVRLIGTKGTHDLKDWDIRSLLGGLRSPLIKIEARLSQGTVRELIIYGGAFGHAVGLSQVGAAGMAEKQKDATAILGHYYPGTTIDRLYD